MHGNFVSQGSGIVNMGDYRRKDIISYEIEKMG